MYLFSSIIIYILIMYCVHLLYSAKEVVARQSHVTATAVTGSETDQAQTTRPSDSAAIHDPS